MKQDLSDPFQVPLLASSPPHTGGLLQAPDESMRLPSWCVLISRQTDAAALASSSHAPSFHTLCLLKILQQKLNFADKLPRAFLKTYSFWEKMSLLTFLPQKSGRYSLWCRDVSLVGLVEALLHGAGWGDSSQRRSGLLVPASCPCGPSLTVTVG